MRGTVYHFDEEQDFGYINGVDGKRYSFNRRDLSQELAPGRGAVVEFQPDDRTAQLISAAISTASSSVGRRPQSSGPAETRPGLLAYFRRVMMEDYRNFKGRASRKEFWAFCLCSTVVLVALLGSAILINLAIGGFDDGPSTSVGYILVLLFMLATILPYLALVVRRLHDIGMTGWFALLCFAPALGGPASLVLGLVPSQFGENRWGRMPAGVSV